MRYRRQVHILTVPVAGDGPVDRRVARADGGAVRGALPGALRRRVGLPRGGHRARLVPAPRRRARRPTRVSGQRSSPRATRRTPSSARCGRGSTEPAPGRTSRATRSTARPRQRRPRPRDRLDADHDARRPARKDGPRRRLPQRRRRARARRLGVACLGHKPSGFPDVPGPCSRERRTHPRGGFRRTAGRGMFGASEL